MPGSRQGSVPVSKPASKPEHPPLRTVDLARAAGVHENTVRLYVEWGFLAEPGRGANGYRLWTASGDLAGALEDAIAHEVLVGDEIARAEAAAAFLEAWAPPSTPAGLAAICQPGTIISLSAEDLPH